MKAKIDSKTVVEEGFATYNVPTVKIHKHVCHINVSASKLLDLKPDGKNQKLSFELDGNKLFLMWDFKFGFPVSALDKKKNKYCIRSSPMVKMINHLMKIEPVGTTTFHVGEFKEGRYELIKIDK